MHVISRKPFHDASRNHPNDADAIAVLYKTLWNDVFKTPDALKTLCPSLDNFKCKAQWWVIDIGGNNLRLIAFIAFRDNHMYVKHIVNHSEYDKLCKRYAKEVKK